jgi:hypothetical protein
MSQRLKRLIASVSGWVSVLFVAMVVTFFVFASGQMLANAFFFSVLIVIPATILAPIWELGRRRVWLAILLVAVTPSVWLILWALFTAMMEGSSSVPDVLTLIRFVFVATLFGQLGQLLCIPAAGLYWIVSHLILSRLKGHPVRRPKSRAVEGVFR